MTIILTPEMEQILNEIKPYLVQKKGKMVFKEGTPERIFELKKKLGELWDEEERKDRELGLW